MDVSCAGSGQASWSGCEGVLLEANWPRRPVAVTGWPRPRDSPCMDEANRHG
jgi:hypothetical protein